MRNNYKLDNTCKKMNTTRNRKFLEHVKMKEHLEHPEVQSRKKQGLLDSNTSICWNKRGQVAIFIIIAIIIVGLILAYFFLLPQVTDVDIPGVTRAELNPSAFLRECIEPDIKDTIDTLSKQGGYADPEGFVTFNGTKVKYLCYTGEDFELCVVQEPFIKNHFEQELNDAIKPKVNDCANELKTLYRDAGYDVSGPRANSNISIVPGRIQIDIITPLTVTRGDTRTFEGFDASIQSQMYDLLSIAGNIIEFEAFYGDSETNLYIQSYPDLKIEKIRLGDGSTVYTVSNVLTNEKFTFASRSLAWPPGY